MLGGSVNMKIKSILNKNPYSLMFKFLGFGFLIVGMGFILFIKDFKIWVAISGMVTGIIFIGIGEIINILQKILECRWSNE